ncbi:MSMEG_1061 family FMN-dependent PPOX-type flavoprotein [Vibrio marisflavi]|nr:MSMEG_1061 family FMN-dependent PPOX-type flavoprotein [Vibrio marisflavi]
MNKFSDFEGVVESFDQIRQQLGEVAPAVKNKVLSQLDEVCESFIQLSPFVVIGTSGSQGQSLSPKGDPAGFVKILSPNYIAIPDRPGNRRADTFENLLENPKIGLMFVVPGKAETLRISGEARIVTDKKVTQSMEVRGHVPEFAIVVHIESAFIHCPKCMQRSKLWKPDFWQDSSHLDSIGEAMIKHAKLDISPEVLDAIAEKEGLKKLY